MVDITTRRRWRAHRLIVWLAGALVAIGVLLAAFALLLDTDVGHRTLIDRIEGFAPDNGLRIKIGRIDGSIYGDATLRDVRLYDTKGLFFRAATAELDWKPLLFITANRLDVNRLGIPHAMLWRMPALEPSKEEKPILPDFDIRIADLDVQRLILGLAISGERRTARLRGRADIRSGRADVNLSARLLDGRDRVALKLVSIPDRGRFDIDARVTAQAGGVVASIAGLDQGLRLVIAGDGDWERWKGRLVANSEVDNTRLARLAIQAREGTYTLGGTVNAARLLKGLPARLGGPDLRVDARTTLENRRFDGTLNLASSALAVAARGRVDLARNRFSNFRVDARLLQPQALLTRMRGRDVRLGLLLDGPIAAPRFEYRLTAPQLAFGKSGFERVEARGRGRFGRDIASIPVLLTAARASGMGTLGDDILTGLRAEGVLRLKDSILTSDLIRVTTRRVRGRVVVLANLRTGSYNIGFDGSLPGYEIPGLGRVDLVSRIGIVPAPRGAGTSITGTATANVRRLDNGFFRGLTGGLPRIVTGIAFTPDGRLAFRSLRLASPQLNLTANGYRRPDGSFHFEGAGRHTKYGPVVATLDGKIDRPRVQLALARPLDSAGLANVRVTLEPDAAGYDFVANGGSLLGPFTANGALLLRKGQDAIIEVTRLAVSGTVATGRLRPVQGGLVGALAIAGGGLNGTVNLALASGIQRVAARLDANNASFEGPPAITIRSGRLNAVALLDPNGTSVNATVQARGLKRGSLTLANLSATARLVDGRGAVRSRIAGSRGRDFSFDSLAQVTPGRIRITGAGSVDRRAIRLARPALFVRDDDGWRLQAAELTHNGGNLRLAGRFGDDLVVDASMNRLPLGLLDIGFPDLGLGGRATGTVQYREPAGAAPTGQAQLRVRGLTRSGTALSSQPIDIAVNAALSARSAALRGIISDKGTTIGRVQGRVSPLGSGSLADRIQTAPLFAQARYAGPADTLWRLSGIDALDISGPVELGADITGRLADPRIQGRFRTEKARVELIPAGAVLTQTRATGRFDGSRLELTSIAGRTEGGAVTGSGSIDLAAARGFGMDIRLEADRAELLDRDDIGATVSGPIRITYDGTDGLIAGDLRLDRSRFRLGRAANAEALPVVRVIEINGRRDVPDFIRPAAPWRLDITARAPNKLRVRGLGIDSEWATNLEIKGTVIAPRMTGTATLVRGTYAFAGRNFRLDEGVIRFLGQVPPDPVLDIVAISEVSGINATINVRGTGQRPEISFASIPALPEDELLSRILFGSSITDISVAEAAQLGTALASLRGGSGDLDPINALRKAVGLDRLRILPADRAIDQGTAIAAGKYLTRRLFVEVVTDGEGYSATRAEFQITRWLSILSTISTVGRQSVNVRVSKDY